MKEKLEQIICRYGYNHQRKKLAEECAELILAIAKDTADTNFIEEMADVSVVIDQIVNHFPKFKAEFERIKEYKINRTVSRINSYENKNYNADGGKRDVDGVCGFNNAEIKTEGGK